MRFSVLFIFLFLTFSLKTFAGSPMNLDLSKSTMKPSDFFNGAAEHIYFQNGRITNEAGLNKRVLACRVEWADYFPVQSIDIESSAVSRTNLASDNFNYSTIVFNGISGRISSKIACKKSFAFEKPSYIDTNEIAAALGKYVKFNFVFTQKPLSFLDFAISNRNLKLKVNRDITIDFNTPSGMPASVLISNGTLIERANYDSDRKITDANQDVIVLSLYRIESPQSVNLIPGDEIVLKSDESLNVSYYSVVEEEFKTSIKAYVPRLDRTFNFKFARAKDFRRSQGSIEDLKATAGDILIFE